MPKDGLGERLGVFPGNFETRTAISHQEGYTPTQKREKSENLDLRSVN